MRLCVDVFGCLVLTGSTTGMEMTHFFLCNDAVFKQTGDVVVVVVIYFFIYACVLKRFSNA